MEIVFFFLLCFLAIAFAFYGGIILGISDCKRRYGIPKGCECWEGDWFTADEIARLSAQLRANDGYDCP